MFVVIAGFAAETTATRFAVQAVRAEKTGLNRSVEPMVLLIFHHATLVAGSHLRTTLVCFLFFFG